MGRRWAWQDRQGAWRSGCRQRPVFAAVAVTSLLAACSSAASTASQSASPLPGVTDYCAIVAASEFVVGEDRFPFGLVSGDGNLLKDVQVVLLGCAARFEGLVATDELKGAISAVLQLDENYSMAELQQSFTQLVYNVSDLIPLGAGMVSSVNPWCFAMLPAYLGPYLGSRELRVAASGGGSAQGGVAVAVAVPAQPARTVLVSLVITAGFIALFGGAGAVITAGGRFIVAGRPTLRRAITRSADSRCGELRRILLAVQGRPD